MEASSPASGGPALEGSAQYDRIFGPVNKRPLCSLMQRNLYLLAMRSLGRLRLLDLRYLRLSRRRPLRLQRANGRATIGAIRYAAPNRTRQNNRKRQFDHGRVRFGHVAESNRVVFS